MLEINFIKNHKSVLNNFFYLGVLRFFNIITKFLLVAYLVRILGEETFGVFTWSDSILQYFIIFINFGFNVFGAKYVVKYKDNKELINEITSSIYFIKGVIFLLSFLILFSLSFIHEINANFSIIILLLVSGLGEVLYPIWYFQGLEKLKPLTIVLVPIKILLLVFTFLFVKSSNDLFIFLFLLVICQILIGILGYFQLARYAELSFKFPKIKILKNIFKKASLYFFGNLATVIFNATTIFLIGIFFSMEKVSGFDISLKVVAVLLIPFDILQMALLPILTKTKNKVMLRKLIYFSFFAGLFIFIFLNLFPENLLSIFGGESITKYSYVLTILSFITLVVPMSFVVGQCGLVAFGYDKEYNYSLIISSVLYLLAVLFFILTDSLDFYTLLLIRVFADVFLVLIRSYYLVINKILIS